MKAKIVLFLCLTVTLTAKAQWGLDANTWNALTPFSDSQMTISDGTASFLNRGILTSTVNFPTSIEISGSFEFTGITSDMFQIDLRTDGTLLSPAENWANGVYIGFGGDEAGLNSANNVKIQGSVVSSYGSFTFAPDAFYNFEITDNGNTINLYLNNLTTPMLVLSDSESYGNEIAMQDSRGTAGGGIEGEGLGVVLDNFSVTPVPEPSTVSLFMLFGTFFYLKRHKRNA
jgi:hypothetical protein